MKCSKCAEENIIKANYCQKCGNKFSDKEKEKAYNKTVYGKYDLFKKWYSRLSLEAFTSHIIFKIASLVIILAVGIYTLLTIGINTKILNSDDYEIFYNEKEAVYYLLVDDKLDEVNVYLYKPNRLSNLNIVHYDNDDNVLDEVNYEDNKEIILKTYNDDYYVLESKYSNNKMENLKVIVYKEGDIY